MGAAHVAASTDGSRGEPKAARRRPETLDQAVARLVRSAVDQGFPRHVEDPSTIALIAGQLRDVALVAPRPRKRKQLEVATSSRA